MWCHLSQLCRFIFSLYLWWPSFKSCSSNILHAHKVIMAEYVALSIEDLVKDVYRIDTSIKLLRIKVELLAPLAFMYSEY